MKLGSSRFKSFIVCFSIIPSAVYPIHPAPNGKAACMAWLNFLSRRTRQKFVISMPTFSKQIPSNICRSDSRYLAPFRWRWGYMACHIIPGCTQAKRNITQETLPKFMQPHFTIYTQRVLKVALQILVALK